jgi:DNA end-binding protein Ku
MGVAAPGAKLAAKEVSMAEKLIEEMTGPWEPRKYHDTYREDLMKRIKEKVKNKETHTLTEASKEAKPRKSAEIIDLMAVLKQSLEKGKGGGHAAKTARHAKRKSARG